MHIEPSSVAGVELIGPDMPEFACAMDSLVGGQPCDALRPALPFSVIVRNGASRPLALIGIRFDMIGPRAKPYSVIHYADTLRYPEKANVPPGALRFVCAEPRYTDMVLRGEGEIDGRGPMNLGNLCNALRISASLDCAAFDDGRFAGPDTLGAYDRFHSERQAEIALLEEMLSELLNPECRIEEVLSRALENTASEERNRASLARRALAKQFQDALAAGGPAQLAARVRNHRLRVPLWRG